MTVAETLAEFLLDVRYDDLPDRAVDHAAMLIASTTASAAYGTTLTSAQIVRDLALDRGGRAEASVWFTNAPKLPLASVAREYHAGLAAMLGVEAVLAARKGYTCELKTLEGPRGFFELYGHTDGLGVTDGLPSGKSADWDIITDLALKLVPGGHPYHALAEAAANAARQGGFEPEEISAIIVSSPGLKTLSGPRHPVDLVGMAHSPCYFAAAGAADRTFGWAHASQEKIDDPVIQRLTDLVEVGPEPTEHVKKYRQGATVTITSKDGRSHTNTVFVPRGAGCVGIDWADVDSKYRALMPASGLAADKIDKSLNVIRHFRDAPGAAALTGLLQ